MDGISCMCFNRKKHMFAFAPRYTPPTIYVHKYEAPKKQLLKTAT